MVAHSSILAWKVPWTEEPGGLHEVTRVRQDLATKPLYNFKHLLYAFQLLIFVLNITDMILEKKSELIQQFVGDRFLKKTFP